MLIARPLMWLALALSLLGAQVACAMRSTTEPQWSEAYLEPSSQSPNAEPGGPSTVDTVTPTAPRRLPSLDNEPLIGVLLADGPEVVFTLLRAAQAGGSTVASGEYRARIAGGQVVLNGTALGPAPLTLTFGAGVTPSFQATLVPTFGKPQRLQFSGEAHIAASTRGISLIERLPMERYLAGVVGTEMTPNWPLEALKSQAIVARSYAAARWMVRSYLPWQLHWHYAVDMAYAGVPTKAQPLVVQALAQTLQQGVGQADCRGRRRRCLTSQAGKHSRRRMEHDRGSCLVVRLVRD